jgi:hypothetical protein
MGPLGPPAAHGVRWGDAYAPCNGRAQATGWAQLPDTVALPEFLHEALPGGRAVDRPWEGGLPVRGEGLPIDGPGG